MGKKKGKKKKIKVCPPDVGSVAKGLMDMAEGFAGTSDLTAEDRARINKEAKVNVKKIMGKLK